MATSGKPKEFMLFMASLVFIWLLLAGLIGLSYEVFRDDSKVTQAGWKFLDYLWDKPVMLIPTTIGLVLAGFLWRRGDLNPEKNQSPFITLLMFVMVCTGAYYTYRLFQWL
jgi:hypothetical protein